MITDQLKQFIVQKDAKINNLEQEMSEIKSQKDKIINEQY